MRLLFFVFIVYVVFSAQDTLLTLSKTSSCLKGLVSSFVKAEDCSHLSDSEKTKVVLIIIQLALHMSECLMKEMGR